ncbi:MAG: hypothetical protein P4L26_15715 [Terracidiphilus sp.]|nr:hypothetical protein [Terracidiphilus sp.]
MRTAIARLLTRLYPRAWRERYGAEFEALLADGRSDLRTYVKTGANVIWSAASEHIFPTQGGNMERDPGSFGAIVRHPSALIPMAMSVTALALVVGHIALYGAAREGDEGAIAHLWQLLMAGQLPVLAFFAIKWLPRAPKPTLGVLALQAGTVLAAMAPVFYFNL